MTSSVAEKYVLQNHTPMTVPTVDPPADGNHRNPMQQFKAYLRRNLLYTARLVQATEQLLTDEVRTQALHTLSYALGERELWPLVRALLLALAPKMELGGHREDWLPYLQQGLAQSKVLGDFATAAECQLQRGLIARLLSDFAGAREQLTASVALATQAGEPRTQARALNELAWLEQLQEAYAAAEGHVAQALTLLDEDDPERAMCYRVLGMIAFGQQKWLEAETYHRRALEIFEQHHDQRRIAWSLQNLAYTLQGQQQYGEAILLFQRAAEMLSEIGDNYHLGIVLLNLGVIYALSERYNEAIDHLSQAETLLHKLHSRLHLARLHNNLGLVYISMRQYANAEQSFRKSVQLFSELEDDSWRLNAMDGLAMAYMAQGKHANASTILQQAIKDLPNIKGMTNYEYLYTSLTKHLLDCSMHSLNSLEGKDRN